MNNKFLFILLFLINILTLTAQNNLSSSNAKAVKIYREAIYNEPFLETKDFIAQIKKVIKLDKLFVEAYWTIANKQYFDDAIKTLNAVLKIKNMPKIAETQIKIAELYAFYKKYDNAIAETEKISDEKFINKKNELLKKYKITLQLRQDTVPYEPKNLELMNTDYDEYFPSITADEKYLSVTRSLVGYYSSEENLFISKNLNGFWLPANPILDLNTNENEGSQSFSADGRYMFFVACRESDCNIYYSINTNGRWCRPINAGFPLNTKDWESNPSLSPAGNELFFASNRRPNFGGRDIWHCDVQILDNGMLKFSNPQNIGKPINTEKDDFAPFIHADNQTLYFASDGHPSIGGYDIFVSRRGKNGIFFEPKNLGFPINTEKNEVALTVNSRGTTAYISAQNKEKPERRLDIYQFELYDAIRPKSMSYVVGNVFDAVSLKKLDAQVEIFDFRTQKTLSESVSDGKTGDFTAFLPDTAGFGLNIRRSGYLFFSAKVKASHDTIFVPLQPIKAGEKIVLNNIFFAFNSAELLQESEKEIAETAKFLEKNPNLKILIIGHTDNIGGVKFNQELSQNRALSVYNALINKGIATERLSYKGFGATQPIADNATDEGREKNRRVEFIIQ
ncbi:MAG: OmpA family protein [Prevotellaceae bacterium]|jgi:outer membrane protein OmpA-like peptidoglycan-associated protein/Tol biopolymer transport system component|nr:OmpA family protein [Prevotellaceae bacterium]